MLSNMESGQTMQVETMLIISFQDKMLDQLILSRFHIDAIQFYILMLSQ